MDILREASISVGIICLDVFAVRVFLCVICLFVKLLITLFLYMTKVIPFCGRFLCERFNCADGSIVWGLARFCGLSVGGVTSPLSACLKEVFGAYRFLAARFSV